MTIQLNDIIEKISKTVEQANERITLLIGQTTDGDDIVRAYVCELGEDNRKDIHLLTNTLLINVWENSERGFNTRSYALDSFTGVSRKIEYPAKSIRASIHFIQGSIDICIPLDDKEGLSFLYQLEKEILELNKKNRAS